MLGLPERSIADAIPTGKLALPAQRALSPAAVGVELTLGGAFTFEVLERRLGLRIKVGSTRLGLRPRGEAIGGRRIALRVR